MAGDGDRREVLIMFYILVQFGDGTRGYQEIFAGVVRRYTDLYGNTFDVPLGMGSGVIDASPPQPSWALSDPSLTPVPAPISQALVTPLAFRQPFTLQERAVIELAATAVSAADQATRLNQAFLRAYLNDLAVAYWVDLLGTEAAS